MSDKAAYRKHNDRSLNSSTYHKKDGTATRAILKREAAEEIGEARRVKATLVIECKCGHTPEDHDGYHCWGGRVLAGGGRVDCSCDGCEEA